MPAVSQNLQFGFRPDEISSLPNLPVIAEHASEAAFLWSQQRRAGYAPHFRLEHLAALHERLLAHLQGLHVAGEAGWRAVLGALADAEPGAVFTATWLAFRNEHREGMRHVIALASADPRFADASAEALAWLPWQTLDWGMSKLAASPVPAHRRIAVAARSAHRTHDEASLRPLLCDPDDGVREQALRAVGRQRLAGLRDTLEAAIASDHANGCRYAAAVSLALLQERGAALRAWQIAAGMPALRREALDVAMRLGDPDDGRRLIRDLAANPATRREAVIAVGAFGDPAALPWLIGCCSEPALAPAAGEAVSMITGVDLDLDDLDAEAADPPAVPIEEDERLPCPDGARLAAWWERNSGRFATGTRHLAGEPIAAASAVQVLRAGYQRQRAAAALELARIAPGHPSFDVVRRADLQLAELAE